MSKGQSIAKSAAGGYGDDFDGYVYGDAANVDFDQEAGMTEKDRGVAEGWWYRPHRLGPDPRYLRAMESAHCGAREIPPMATDAMKGPDGVDKDPPEDAPWVLEQEKLSGKSLGPKGAGALGSALFGKEINSDDEDDTKSTSSRGGRPGTSPKRTPPSSRSSSRGSASSVSSRGSTTRRTTPTARKTPPGRTPTKGTPSGRTSAPAGRTGRIPRPSSASKTPGNAGSRPAARKS
jgi:hypothetical protein